MLQRTCTHCGTLNHIPPERAERANRCLECGEVLSELVVIADETPPPPPAPVLPPPPPAATAPTPSTAEPALAPRRFSSFFIHDMLSFEVSAIVHATGIFILGLIVDTPPMVRTLNLVSSPSYAEEFIEELTPSPLESIEVVSTEFALAPEAPTMVFDPRDTIYEDGIDSGPEEFNLGGGLDQPSEFGLPTAPLALLLGNGGSARGGGMVHSRGDLAVFSQRLKKSGAKTGDIQVSLIWQNYNDLDLHVQAPSGERIYFQNRRARCRGVLDVDMNAGGRESDEPVENIYWPLGRAPSGEYVVFVDHYANHGDTDPTSFEVLVQIDGVIKTFRKSISSGEPPLEIYRFERTKTKQRIDSPNDDFPL